VSSNSWAPELLGPVLLGPELLGPERLVPGTWTRNEGRCWASTGEGYRARNTATPKLTTQATREEATPMSKLLTGVETAADELSWEHRVEEVPESGLSAERTAEPGERVAVARALDLIALTLLCAQYSITPNGRGRYRLKGSLTAEIEQACVITLESVASTITERFDVSFLPTADMPARESGVLTMDEEFDPEPIREGRIAVGRVVFETLAAAIDPFPRQPGATLERHSTAPQESAGGMASPFSVLANLRDKD